MLPPAHPPTHLDSKLRLLLRLELGCLGLQQRLGDVASRLVGAGEQGPQLLHEERGVLLQERRQVHVHNLAVKLRGGGKARRIRIGEVDLKS